MYDVAIIGAGVVGGLIARERQNTGSKFAFLKKKVTCRWGRQRPTAPLHAGHDAKPGTLKALLNVRGSKMFEGLQAELELSTNASERL